jgi:hypothetical protein
VEIGASISWMGDISTFAANKLHGKEKETYFKTC